MRHVVAHALAEWSHSVAASCGWLGDHLAVLTLLVVSYCEVVALAVQAR